MTELPCRRVSSKKLEIWLSRVLRAGEEGVCSPGRGEICKATVQNQGQRPQHTRVRDSGEKEDALNKVTRTMNV